jgi:hypothetical protein
MLSEEENPPQNDSARFGIGCFAFTYHPEIPSDIQGEDYLVDLRNALGSITNIEKIIVEADPEFSNLQIHVTEPFERIGESFNFFPYPATNVEIEFEIFIPTRVQKDLSPWMRVYNCGERFRVRILHAYYFPIALIQPLKAEEDCDPSFVVAIVREFIESKFQGREEERIHFEYLGPSPFHADFYISPWREGDLRLSNGPFNFHIVAKRTYDSIYITYESEEYDDIESAMHNLLYELEGDLGLFYYVQNNRDIHLRKWFEISGALENLIVMARTTGVKGFWNRMVRVFWLIRDLLVSLTEFESSLLISQYYYQKGLDELHRGGNKPPLASYIRDIMKDLPSFPTDQIRQLISLFESRREKALEGVLLLASALIGGVVGGIAGSLLTILLSK